MKFFLHIFISLAFLFPLPSVDFVEESTAIDKDWKFSHLLANHEWPEKIALQDIPKEEFCKEHIAIIDKDIYYFSGRGKDFYGYENMENFCFYDNRVAEIRYLFSKLQNMDETMKLYDKLTSYLGKRFPDISRLNPKAVYLSNKKLHVIVVVKHTNCILVSFSPYEQ